MVVQCDPLTLGVLRPPGDFGVDVAVGEGQSLGNRLDFGGPSFGFFAAQQAYLRKMPGRIAGETTDVDGRRGFVLTLQTREQHIRREKATHNICTAQALNALAGVIYLSWLGRRGIGRARRAAAAAHRLRARARWPRSTASSCCTSSRWCASSRSGWTRRSTRVIERCAAQGVNPGYPLGADSPSSRTACWWRSPSSARRPTSTGSRTCSAAVREAVARASARRVPQQRDRACTIYEKSVARAGARSSRPRSTCRATTTRSRSASAAPSPPKLPEIAEPEIVRHYNRLSKRNFDLDTGFYPLGSCTMKHNPKLHERVAALPGNARLHPLQAPEPCPGRAAADVGAAARARRDRRAAARVAAAVGRLTGRAGGRAAHPRLPRGARRAPHEGAHAGHRARHEPRDGHDGRLRGRQGRHRRRRRRRHRGPEGQARATTSPR